MPKNQTTVKEKQTKNGKPQKQEPMKTSKDKKKQTTEKVPVSKVTEKKKAKPIKSKIKETSKMPNDKSDGIRELTLETACLMNISAVDKVNSWLQGCVVDDADDDDVSCNSSVELWREEATEIGQERHASLFPDDFYKNLGRPNFVKTGTAQKNQDEEREAFFAKLKLASLKQGPERKSSLVQAKDASLPLTYTDTQTGTYTYCSLTDTQSKLQTATQESSTQPYKTEYATETQSNLQTASQQSSKRPYSTEYETETQSNLQTITQPSNKLPYSTDFETVTETQSNFQTDQEESNKHIRTSKSKDQTDQTSQNARRSTRKSRSTPKTSTSESKTGQFSNKQKLTRKSEVRRPSSIGISLTTTDLDLETPYESAKRRRLLQESTPDRSQTFKVPRSPNKGRKRKLADAITSTRIQGDETNLDGETLDLSAIQPNKVKSKGRPSHAEDKENAFKQPKTPRVTRQKKPTKPVTSTRLFEDTGFTDGLVGETLCVSAIQANVTEKTPARFTRATTPKSPKKGPSAKVTKSRPASSSRLFEGETTQGGKAAQGKDKAAEVKSLEKDECRVKTSTPISKGGQKFNFEIDISSVNHDISNDSSIGLYIEPSCREVNSQEIVCQSETLTLIDQVNSEEIVCHPETLTLIDQNNNKTSPKRSSRNFRFLSNQHTTTDTANSHKNQTITSNIKDSFKFVSKNSTSSRKNHTHPNAVWKLEEENLSFENLQKYPSSTLHLITKRRPDQKTIFVNRNEFMDMEKYPIDILCLL